ncbi:protein kinase domain-containing protein [Gilvimarinus sp. F26214L]|uniref:protein kinase domain-containing protein n=1 Tax=Gilvimarinus sp. DZF01 TaxID=3461371 RepID=UPI004045FFC0
MDDKTVIKVPGRSTAESADADTGNGAGPDRTRFKPRATAPEKTRIKSEARPAPADTTRFKRPAPPPDDRTRVQPLKPLGDATAGEEGADSRHAGAVAGDDARAQAKASGYDLLKNRFVFEEVLGAGGMGIVYKAKDLLKVEAQDRDPYVAIKVLSDEFRAHPEAFIALQRESRKTQRMAHPNIVSVYDFDRDGDTVFMTMEYMDGTPLDKLISQYRGVGLPTETIWQILEGISAALTHAHEQSVIHSDFKPGNIFVTSSGTAKVFDFGIARAVAKAENREESKDDRTVFDAGTLGALTPAYASLEMLEGKTPDVRDDIYALGCIAYELFTGEHPYNRMHADEAQRQGIRPKRIAGLKKSQWRAIERALAFERANRTESVDAFWRELTRKASHTGKIAAGFLLLLGVAGGAAFQYWPQEQNPFSEDQFRSEIERNLRIELKKEALETLYETAEFSAAWEADLWNDVQELRALLGEDEWLLAKESAFYELYLQEIDQKLQAVDLQRAGRLVDNAARYTSDPVALEAFQAKIEAARLAQQKAKAQESERQQALAEERRRAAEQAKEQARKNDEFDSALANVDRQLQCHTTIDIKDFGIAVGQLRTISSQRYSVEEPRITRSLALCLEKIGAAFPERAEDAKRAAMRLFPRNATIAGINIVPRDPCGPSLAGAGARGRGATCSDKARDVRNPPTMVVIPGTGAIKTFAIGQFEVTVREFNEFCSATGKCAANEAADRSLPAHNISLAAARGYLNWLSEQSGRRYRLPTKAEWQHAAGAQGSRVDSNRNCHLNSRGISKGNALVKASIGQKNRWGLVNHLGNAREWVSDRGGRYLAMGGSFETAMDECTVQHSTPHSGEPDPVTGFRVLREVDG